MKDLACGQLEVEVNWPQSTGGRDELSSYANEGVAHGQSEA